MKRRGFQISGRQQLVFYTASVVLFVSGIIWAGIHRLDESGQAGEALRRMSPWLIAVHGLGAVVFVLFFGALLVGHVRRAWRGRKNRKNGALFVTATSLLIASGYLLYYLGGENLRDAFSQFHLWLGIVSPALLLWHIRSGKKAVNQ